MKLSLNGGMTGFTLIELAAVLAVTAMIGMLGVSAYRTYRVRAEIASGVTSTTGVRDRVIAAFKTTGIPNSSARTDSSASSSVPQIRKRAVGTPRRAMNAFANALLGSN